jgi:phosphoglycolate phosphatase
MEADATPDAGRGDDVAPRASHGNGSTVGVSQHSGGGTCEFSQPGAGIAPDMPRMHDAAPSGPQVAARVATVLLDLDGTLSDSRPGIAASFRFTLAELGHDPQAAGDLTWAVGPPIAVSIRRLLAMHGDDRVGRAVEIYRDRYSSVGLYDCAVFPGVPAMLDALRNAGLRMFIATSKRRDFAERVIDHLALRRYVQRVYGALQGGGLDDKNDLLAHILKVERLSADRTVMLGDRLHDALAAKANGLRCIGALWGYGGRAELETAGADAMADTPDAVAGLILQRS